MQAFVSTQIHTKIFLKKVQMYLFLIKIIT